MVPYEYQMFFKFFKIVAFIYFVDSELFLLSPILHFLAML